MVLENARNFIDLILRTYIINVVLKSFEIEYKGKMETVEYEDDINHGPMDSVLKASLDVTNPLKPKIDISTYRTNLLPKVLRKAPFPFKTIGDINIISHKTINVVMTHIADDYPITNFLEDWMKSLIGSEAMKSASIQPITSVPQNSDGINKPSTDNQ